MTSEDQIMGMQKRFFIVLIVGIVLLILLFGFIIVGVILAIIFKAS